MLAMHLKRTDRAGDTHAIRFAKLILVNATL